MDSRSFTFPKGEYFFGDLGYLFPHPNYPTILNDDWMDICDNDEGDWEYKNKDYFLFDTGGDGYFLNHRGGESLPVDSGSLGLMQTEVIDSEILDKAKGIIFNAEHELRIDVQGEEGRTVGVHIYQKRNKYYFKDDAIFIAIDEEEIDESYFLSRCPKFAKGDENNELFSLEETEEDDDKEEDNNPTNIIKKCTEQIEFNPRDYSPYLERARTKKSLKDYNGAINDFKKAVQLNKSIAGYVYRELGELQVKLGDIKKAINSYSKGIKLNANNLIYYCRRGYARYTIGEHNEAVEDCKKAISINKEYAPAFYTLGLIKRRLGEHQEAIENFTKASNLGKNNRLLSAIEDHIILASINMNYGHLNANQNYINIAFEEYQKAIDIDEDNREIYFNRAADRLISGDKQGACNDWMRGSDLGDKDAIKLLKDLDQKPEIYNEENGDQFIKNGMEKYKSRDYEEAIKEFTKAIDIDPENADAYFKRGNAKNQLGDTKGASEDKNKSNEINLSYMQ